jgi:hypothetical protein
LTPPFEKANFETRRDHFIVARVEIRRLERGREGERERGREGKRESESRRRTL